MSRLRRAVTHVFVGSARDETDLAAMALEHPERFEFDRMNLPAAQTPPPRTPV